MNAILLSAGIAGVFFLMAGFFVKPKIPKCLCVFLGISALISAGGYSAWRFFSAKKTPAPAVSIPQSAVTAPVVRRDKLTMEQLQFELDLSDYQVKRLRPIMKEESLRRSALVRKYGGSPQEQQSLQKELKLFQSYYEDMYSHILNETQFSEYKRLREAHSSDREK